MAIIVAKWKDNDNHVIEVKGKVSHAILTIEDVSDEGLLDSYKYILRNKKTVSHKINGESFPLSEDTVLDVSYDLRDILKTLDDVVKDNYYGGNIDVIRCEHENGMCRHLIGSNGSVYELVGYGYDYDDN